MSNPTYNYICELIDQYNESQEALPGEHEYLVLAVISEEEYLKETNLEDGLDEDVLAVISEEEYLKETNLEDGLDEDDDLIKNVCDLIRGEAFVYANGKIYVAKHISYNDDVCTITATDGTVLTFEPTDDVEVVPEYDTIGG